MLNVTRHSDQLVVVAIAGRVDSLTSPALETEFLALVGEGPSRLVLDLGGVAFLASAGLRLLLRVENVCRQKSGIVVLASIPQPVALVMDIAGFSPHFRRYGNAAEAVAALALES